jgi:hypothetical protein
MLLTSLLPEADMAESTGPALMVGAISLANVWFLQPMASGKNPNLTQGWRIIPATLVFALALGGLEKLSPVFAKGIAYIALITVCLTEPTGANAPVVNLADILGYNTTAKTTTSAKIA